MNRVHIWGGQTVNSSHTMDGWLSILAALWYFHCLQIRWSGYTKMHDNLVFSPSTKLHAEKNLDHSCCSASFQQACLLHGCLTACSSVFLLKYLLECCSPSHCKQGHCCQKRFWISQIFPLVKPDLSNSPLNWDGFHHIYTDLISYVKMKSKDGCKTVLFTLLPLVIISSHHN